MCFMPVSRAVVLASGSVMTSSSYFRESYLLLRDTKYYVGCHVSFIEEANLAYRHKKESCLNRHSDY